MYKPTHGQLTNTVPVAAPFFFFWRHKNDVTFNLIKFHLKGAVGREQGEGSLYDINLKFALGIVTEAKEYSQKKRDKKGNVLRANHCEQHWYG